MLVIHEWWGLNEHIKHYADRLAAEGYASLAVDLYGGEVATTPDRAMELVKSVSPKKAQGMLTAAHQFLAEDSRIQASSRGVIGWCFGGGWALQHAVHAKDLDAAVMYYGRVVTDVDRLRDIEAPILGVFANNDESIPPDQVDAFDQALDRADVRHQIERYDAEHAFANPSSARYDEAAAAKAWEKTSAFLAESLKPTDKKTTGAP
jgi:carboxymethylenebutenolidase